MHTDEKRQVNELLAQLDRISGRNVVVVATTNYVRGIDRAIQRSGRFDVRLPVFPPDQADRVTIFDYYLSPPRIKGFKNTAAVDKERLATEAILFTPADIKSVVQAAARQAIRETVSSQEPSLSTENISSAIVQHHRRLHRKMVIDWAREAAEELGHHDKQLLWLEDEISQQGA
jgi:SpoVK/Ycf46/Vps4 family AAA+-type ATPase